MLGLNAGGRPRQKELFEALVAKALDHGLDCNLSSNGCQTCQITTLFLLWWTFPRTSAGDWLRLDLRPQEVIDRHALRLIQPRICPADVEDGRQIGWLSDGVLFKECGQVHAPQYSDSFSLLIEEYTAYTKKRQARAFFFMKMAYIL